MGFMSLDDYFTIPNNVVTHLTVFERYHSYPLLGEMCEDKAIK